MARGVAPHRPLDPVSLEIVWHRLIAVVDEAATSLVRTSFYPIVRESNDFSCALYDASGNDIVENTSRIPSFNMTAGPNIRHGSRRRPQDRWR